MTTINNTFNFNVNFNAQPSASIAQSFGQQLAAGIFASFARPLGASPFASAQLPRDFNFTGGNLQHRCGCDEPKFVPAKDATWSATLKNEHQGSIDLGDGYTLQMDERNSEVTIHNAETGETTKIWGDPHVDIDGKHAFDFWGTTTFQLENGTKITINTEQSKGNANEYLAETLTITKGDKAIVVDGLSQNTLGDLTVSQSNNGRAIDAFVRDGFVLEENATGAGWRSQLTGDVATQADLNLTKVGQAYGPGSGTPSLGEVSQQLSNFLFFGIISSLAQTAISEAAFN